MRPRTFSVVSTRINRECRGPSTPGPGWRPHLLPVAAGLHSSYRQEAGLGVEPRKFLRPQHSSGAPRSCRRSHQQQRTAAEVRGTAPGPAFSRTCLAHPPPSRPYPRMLSGTPGSLARSVKAWFRLRILLQAARPAIGRSKRDASARLPRGGARLLPSGATSAPGGRVLWHRVVELALLSGSPACRTRDLPQCGGCDLKGDINFNNANTFNPQYLKYCRFSTN